MSTGTEGPDHGGRPPEGAGEELVEVVDEDGRVLEVVTRSRMRAERLRHRCTFVVVRDPSGRVLVHQRSPHKDMWPSRWDLAAGGVVRAGEDWDDAAARELGEEVGVVGVPLVPLAGGTTVSYADRDVAELARIWTATWDGPVTFADGEVIDARWVTVEELRDLVRTESFVADSLALVLPLVLGEGDGTGGEISP
ncbi:NUDIX domain-containing protein [Dermatobacter hominis]|uniref:NUDIX domain-containing protein n=1 Tax=Dermatobacter hominis TaxID=2884263 RepID=UPI001D11F212|nr:NUDIX domain-containing protein [Dermatobacter hominis]UDY37102.1 NUDIX domain-containing protein [Dermatobacter hominis]